MGRLLLFWFIDAPVPGFYQAFVFGSSYLPTLILPGFFLAVISALSIRMDYRQFAMQGRR